MKKIWSFLIGAAIPLLLAAVLLLTGVLQLGGAKRIEGKGYASPQEAVEAFGRYWQKGDLEGMLSTFAMESFVEHLDPEAYLSYTDYNAAEGQFSSGLLPNNSSLSGSLNLEGRRALISEEICVQCLYLLLQDTPYDWVDGPYTLYKDPEAIAGALAALGKQGRLTRIEVLKGFTGEELLPDYTLSERYYQWIERQSAIYGADEYRNAALKLRIDGQEYYLCFALVRYGDRWYNLFLDSGFSSRLSTEYNHSALVPVSEAKVGTQR